MSKKRRFVRRTALDKAMPDGCKALCQGVNNKFLPDPKHNCDRVGKPMWAGVTKDDEERYMK